MKPVSLHKYRNEDSYTKNEERYEKNYRFLSKVVSYEMDILLEMENVYHHKNTPFAGKNMKKIVKKEKMSIFPFALFCMLTIGSVLAFSTVYYGNYYLLIPMILGALLSYGSGAVYFGEDNKKLPVLGRAYKVYAEQDIISNEELISLQDLIEKEEMLELLRSYGNHIPMSAVTQVLWIEFSDFRDYMAERKYRYIEMQKKYLSQK